MSKGRTSKICKSAQGQPCQIRMDGVCNFSTETTVLAHWNGGGMGKKNPDFIGAYACSACHDAVDGRSQTNHTLAERKMMFIDGIFRTQILLHEQGLITTKGSK